MKNQNSTQLRNRLAEIAAEAQAIQANAADRDLNADELARIDVLASDFKQVEARIASAELAERAATPVPTGIAPAPVNGYGNTTRVPAYRGASTTGTPHGTGGFNSPGEFFACVRAASAGQVDPRLKNAITTYGNENGPGGADGGFAVPSDWKASILELVAGEGTLINALNPIYTPSNQVVLPVDENSPHASTGITAEWTGEAAAITASKPALKTVTLNLNKVAGLVHLSDELLEDSPATGAYTLRILAKKIRFVVEDAIVAGNGNAKPLGFLNAPGLVTQAKSASGSTAITATDLGNMVSRMIPGSYNNAVWVCHSTVLPKLWTLTLGQQPIVVQDLTKSPFGSILGRPVIVSESCSDYNTAGDIFLVSPDGYGLAMKSAGIRTDSTLAFAFDQGLQSFRATMRVGGAPLLSAAVTRKNGSATSSHIICLGVRS